MPDVCREIIGTLYLFIIKFYIPIFYLSKHTYVGIDYNFFDPRNNREVPSTDKRTDAWWDI